MRFILVIITLLSCANVNVAQTPNLGTTADYVLFTAAGALGNTGVSVINGNIGTGIGAITGFGLPTVVNGTTEEATSATAQGAMDVQTAYTELMAIPATVTNHAPVFGNGETLFPGVYNIGAAGSTAATLTLDGQGDPNAVFIFQFGGAFTTAASTTVILTNGANARNVFWGANGAIAMAAITAMQGTLIANGGAISMGAGGSLVGRMLSTVGAASVYNVTISLPDFVLPVEMEAFTGRCIGQQVVLNWSTATEKNNAYFTVERSVKGLDWQMVGKVNGKGNSSARQSYTFTDQLPGAEASFYRLKQTDFNAVYQYGDVVGVEKCGDAATPTVGIYPNPSNGNFILSFSGHPDEVNSTVVFNAQGQQLSTATGFQSTLDLSDRAPGVYFVQVELESEAINLKMVVKR